MPALLAELNQLPAPYRLEQITACLVNSILDYQKDGPYYVGGWSDAGVVAFETARQLMEKGHEVAWLVMFDTPNPAFQRSVLKEFWLDSRAKKIRFLVAELLRLKLKDAPVYIAEKVKEIHRRIWRAAWQIQYKTKARRNSGHLENPVQIVHLAVSSYRPTPYIGRLAFFKAAERSPGDTWDFSRGWTHLVTGGFEVYEVPGDHRSMFLEPNVETLATIMKNHFCSRGSGHAAVG